MPGTILSQLGMQIIASKQWAWIIVSTLSAMISREGSEYFIPAWPMAIPSSTPIVLNRNGMPPAAAHAFLDIIADRLEVDVPRDDVDVAVADRDEGLVPVALAHAGGAEQAAVGGAGVAPLDHVGTHGAALKKGVHDGRSIEPILADASRPAKSMAPVAFRMIFAVGCKSACPAKTRRMVTGSPRSDHDVHGRHDAARHDPGDPALGPHVVLSVDPGTVRGDGRGRHPRQARSRPPDRWIPGGQDDPE